MKSQIAVILPAFNEDKVIKKTLKDLRSYLKKDKSNTYKIIVIDDGSTDKTLKISKKHADIIIHHKINRGLGAALATGLEYIKRNKQYDFAITFDSDGQHSPKDIRKAVNKLKKGYDVIIGSRFLNKKSKIPKIRRAILILSNLITYLFFQIWTSDSQSGFRGFNRKAINKIQIQTNQMEVSSEFFAEIKKNNLKLIEIPIDVKYTKYSLSKGQTNLNGIKVLIKLLYKLSH